MSSCNKRVLLHLHQPAARRISALTAVAIFWNSLRALNWNPRPSDKNSWKEPAPLIDIMLTTNSTYIVGLSKEVRQMKIFFKMKDNRKNLPLAGGVILLYFTVNWITFRPFTKYNIKRMSTIVSDRQQVDAAYELFKADKHEIESYFWKQQLSVTTTGTTTVS